MKSFYDLQTVAPWYPRGERNHRSHVYVCVQREEINEGNRAHGNLSIRSRTRQDHCNAASIVSSLYLSLAPPLPPPPLSLPPSLLSSHCYRFFCNFFPVFLNSSWASFILHEESVLQSYRNVICVYSHEMKDTSEAIIAHGHGEFETDKMHFPHLHCRARRIRRCETLFCRNRDLSGAHPLRFTPLGD